jgi:catechol 2,3-dioxygenase-like lactoylglutathione lyase family enzyme
MSAGVSGGMVLLGFAGGLRAPESYADSVCASRCPGSFTEVGHISADALVLVQRSEARFGNDRAGTSMMVDDRRRGSAMIGTLRAVALDAPDARRLAAFYAALTGWTEQYADDEWITLLTPDGWRIAVQRSPDLIPPRWPDPAYPQQAHLDLRVPDLETATATAVQLGAELLRRNETWHTLADPAGHPFDLCLFGARQDTTLMGVMLDCPDAAQLSRFYAALLGKPVTYEGDGMAMIGEDGAQPLLFQQITGYRPPRWPDPAHPQQVHLDITVTDVDSAEAAVLDLGATALPASGDNWRVYADPAGKPFCLCWGETPANS